MKRGRNQRRRPGANPNRALDSNGPEVRIRGTANQVYDKYIALARDATSAGDRVKVENYLQHAEHYFRVLRASQPAQPPRPANGEGETEGDQPSVSDREDRNNNRRNDQGRQQNQSQHQQADEKVADEEVSETPAQAPAEAPVETNSAPEPTAGEDESEKKPRRRRTRRPAKSAESKDDETAETEKADAETAAAAE